VVTACYLRLQVRIPAWGRIIMKEEARQIKRERNKEKRKEELIG
jgi:hypothetical protein